MINLGRKLTVFAAAIVMALGVSDVFQPSQALTNAGSITALDVALTEDFDSLSAGGTWTDNVTVPGWYSNRIAFVTGTGSSATGALYSFGVLGTNPASDRALGSVASGTTLSIYQAAKLTNNTGTTITSLDISYVGEQWRNGGNTTAQSLPFQYQVANAGTVTTVLDGTWTSFTPLTFTGPIATATAGPLDGNFAANRVAKSATLAVTVNAGQEIWLRWQDDNDAGNDHGLAIDNFSVTAHGVDPAPAVLSTNPANGATNVAINANIAIIFSETVNTDPGAFTLECPAGTAHAIDASTGPEVGFLLNPTTDLPYGTTCEVTVVANNVSDADIDDPNDHMASNYTFSFTTVSLTDPSAPSVTGTTPANLAVDVLADSNIVVNFSEEVEASPSSFALNCSGLQSFALSGSPATSFTLNPDVNLPYAATCAVTVFAAGVTDTDEIDPPDNMAADYTFTFTTEDAPPPVATNVIINELDADTPGADTAEFVELYDGGVGNTSLTGLAIVLYTGGDLANQTDTSYAAIDLDGYSTDANGYFILGNALVPGVGHVFANNGLQNGADAVALYAGNASSFPNGTHLTTTNLQDAVVYDTDDADLPLLLALLNSGEPQVNENGGGSGTTQSIGRCQNGSGGARNTSTYITAAPTPGGPNACPPPVEPTNAAVVISQIYGGGGNAGAIYLNDYVELYNRSMDTVDLSGWSLQYASSTGSGWAFTTQPIGGTIAPGKYYLIALESGGDDGAALPPANVNGQINISGTSGKLALVASFEGLVGNCPIPSEHLIDFVGYGSADCREGTTTAPAPSNTTAIFRLGNGATDTDRNGNDFVTGAPAPRQTEPIVELGPLVFGTDPRPGSTTAPRDATIQVTFTELVNVDGSWFDINCAGSGPHNSATFGSDDLAHYITPNGNFVPGEQCTVTIFAAQVSDQDSEDTGANTDHLPANYTWSFTVATGTAPPYLPDVHLTMGNPNGAVADEGQPDNFLMEKPEFALAYNRAFGRPNWVSWHLSDEWIGTLTRVDTFRADPAVPPDWYRVQSFDFLNSGFDRGHMVPNADRDKETSIPINQATFLMSNMIAQAPDNNQGPWAAFENYLRTLLPCGPPTPGPWPCDEIYIVAGGVGSGGTGSNGPATTIANGDVAVPAQTWKVALVLPKAAGDDISRVSCATRTIAILMPNVQGIRNDPWENYITTVDAIESLTGYDFFSNLPSQIEQCVEAGTNGDNPPLDSIAPAIDCAMPDGAWHGDNITLACTASDSGSGLANPSDAAFSLMTLVVGGVEDGNASTDSRVVCDKAGNCVTAGPIAGNKIDRKAPSITLATPADGARYQLNRVVTASFSCAETASGLASCDGTVANGAAIDTASIGPKVFSVSAVDAVGNAASVTANYTVAVNTIAINNLPSAPLVGDSFTPTFDYGGDGVTSVTSNTPNRCTVSGGTVTFIHKGKCRLVAHATATASFDAATGAIQLVVIDKDHPDISIANIPTNAVNGGSFVPVFDYDGDGVTRVRSETPAVCRVRDGEVRFVAGGTCTLTPIATRSPGDYRVEGDPQSFNVGPAATTISMRNIPNKPKAGRSFEPRFDYDGDGDTSVTSSTPAVCSVTGDTVNFLSAGTCTLTAHATATASYLEATGSPESFVVK